MIPKKIILMVAFMLCGCGGGSGEDSSAIKIAPPADPGLKEDSSAIKIAPPADPGLNVDTKNGIDANSNGVRDDVELAIIRYWSKDIDLYGKSMNLAREYQRWIVDNSENPQVEARRKILEEVRFGKCIINSNNITEQDKELIIKDILYRTFNTRDRIKVLISIKKNAGSFSVPNIYGSC